MAGRRAMSPLRSALERYVAMRRGLGCKFQHQERRLINFVAFMEERGASTITRPLALEWATLPPGRHSSWTLRLTDVRGFARHLASIDGQTEVPAAGILHRFAVPSPIFTRLSTKRPAQTH